MIDILIKNGTILDGTGAKRFRADVAIEKGVITEIRKDINEEAKQIIDAGGLFVTPGFIDTHAHSDSVVFFQNDCYNCLEQGITLQMVGNCGVSPAPYAADSMIPLVHQTVSKEEMELIKCISKDCETFMQEAKKKPLGTNMAFLVGHNAIRAHAMGQSDDKPTKSQLDDMKKSISKAMKAGYFGYSTGLVYAPSVYADTEELIELAKATAEYNGIYASHIRGEGNTVVEAVKEALRIGREGGARVLISHLKVMGQKSRGKSEEILSLIRQANADGTMHAFADQYPYEAGSAPLITQIPPKYLTGGMADTLRKLHDSAVRKQIDYSIFHEADEFESALYCSSYEGATIAMAAETPQYVGRSIADIAREEGKAPIDVMCDMLIANCGTVQGIYKCLHMEDILSIMADENVFAGCDWYEYPEHYDPEKCGGGHPRGTATMIRRLELIRDNGLRTAEACIRSMTGGPAEAMGFKNRGLLKEGYAADICVLDYAKAYATADFMYPFRKNQGLYWVLVNGEVAVKSGACLGKYAGQVVLH